eukprot:Transcript_28241.p2 GENE.Transcript_28241~~Transcript_28241.p2  ORF type:complete len:245 (-),score=127.57 Transcript_28241:298-1032(-)
MSFDEWRAEYPAGGSSEPPKPNGKAKGKGKGKGGGGKPKAEDDVDALVASIEAPPAPADEVARLLQRSTRAALEQLLLTKFKEGSLSLDEVSALTPAGEEAAAEPSEPAAAKASSASAETAASGAAAAAGPSQASVAWAEEESKEGEGEGEGEEAREREAKRAEVMAKVAAARAAQALAEAERRAAQEEGRQSEGRKLNLEDLLSAEEAALLDKGFERNDKYDNTTVKDFRMQQEFGAKKFIKP